MSEDIIMKMYVITHPLAERLANWGQKNLACNFTRRRQSHIFIWCNLIYYYTDSPISQMVVEAASLLVLSDGYDSVMPLDPLKKRKLLFSCTRLYNILTIPTISVQYSYYLTYVVNPSSSSQWRIYIQVQPWWMSRTAVGTCHLNKSKLRWVLEKKGKQFKTAWEYFAFRNSLNVSYKKSVLPCSGESHYNEYRFLLLFLTFTPCFPQPPISCCRYRVNNCLTLYIPTS